MGRGPDTGRRTELAGAEGARLKTGQDAARCPRELWLERQLNDPYVARAKREGFRSRAAYKLIEIDDKHHLSSPARVWSISAPRPAAGARSRPSASAREQGRVIAIDLLDMEPIAGVDFLQIDFLDRRAPERLKAHARRRRPTSCSPTWRRTRPAIARPTICASWRWREAAADFAREVLAPGGASSARCCRAAPR